MTNLENLKILATEAAQSDFLWELGKRAPSANQVRDFCKKWSIVLADEKRIKAVMRLREDDPQILQEIRDDAAGEGDETMVETMYGLEHFKIIAAERDIALWAKIAKALDIEYLVASSDRRLVLCRKVEGHFDISRAGLGGWEPAISIWPTNAHDASSAKYPTHTAPAFYNNNYELDDGQQRYVRRNNWRMAVVSVKSKEFLFLGKKIAHAYEAETARRKKPAKAVVLKNY